MIPRSPMPDTNATERFVQRLIGAQDRLTAYITLLLGNPALVGDVLQETNLVLWRKAAEFDETRDFGSWACGIARFQVMAYVRDRQRDRHHFGEELVRSLAETATSIYDAFDPRESALDHCLKKLTPLQRSLLNSRYVEEAPLGTIARDAGRTTVSVTKQLSRIRQQLLKCIQRQLSKEEGP